MLAFSHFYRLNTLILGQFPCFSGIFHIKPLDRPIFLNYPENLHGSLNREATRGKFIVPTESYRGEGCSYYFAAPSDYITVENARKLSAIFTELDVPHVTGRVWTTDAMIRETAGLVAQRRSEGCLAVEMELAGVQAVCSFYGLSLYNFLEAGDVLEESGYDVANLRGANHDLGKLYIALETALRI